MAGLRRIVRKLLRTVPVRKPNKQDFIQVHPDPTFRENFAVIELKEDSELYLVAGADLAAELAAEVVNMTLFTTINRQGVVFMWPVRLPDADGKMMDWHRSARDAADVAQSKWIRVVANKSLGAYEIIVAEKISSAPKWLEIDYQGAAAHRLPRPDCHRHRSSDRQEIARDLVMLDAFREVVKLDTEFECLPGERQRVVCCVAKELRSGRTFRIFEGEFGPVPPFATGADVLTIAYYSSAEWGSYLGLGWPMPERVLDLFCEFRDRTNGLSTPAGAGLLGALTYFGLDGMGATEKKEIQQAIGNGTCRGRYTREEILDYCDSDVTALERLLPAMVDQIDLPRALLRGRYMVAVARMEFNGTPIDVETLERLREGWTGIQDQLIAAIDASYGVYDGRAFRQERFAKFLARHGIPWPLLESGHLDLSDDTFRQQAKSYPIVSPLRELRSSLSEMRLNHLAVGADGRNRCMLSALRARSGRNQPTNAKFIFGPSVWLRGLIKPPPGYGVAYVEWSQQEFAIAAELSGDVKMRQAYLSGDPYLAFGKQAGLIPAGGTKASHKFERELCKQCVLATNYGMGDLSLALRIGQPVVVARELLRAHREAYEVFWRWSDAAVDTAMSTNSLHTAFGWHVHVGENSNPRFLRNFPAQGNGAEMMRIAACLATERGVEVCAPIHDAFLLAAPLERLESDIATMRHAMAEASAAVLGGFEINTDVSVVKYPNRYMDPRGAVMWTRVLGLLPSQHQQRAAS